MTVALSPIATRACVCPPSVTQAPTRSRNDGDLAAAFVAAVRHRGGVDRAAVRNGQRIALLRRLYEAVGLTAARCSDCAGLQQRGIPDDLLQRSPQIAAVTASRCHAQ